MQNYEFQAVLSFATGLFLGMLSWGLYFTLAFIFIFEIVLYIYTVKYPPMDSLDTRISINAIFLLGWILSRSLYLRETGLEPSSELCE